MGDWGLEPPLGNATRGLSPRKNCEKEHFLLQKPQKPKIMIQHSHFLLYICISALFASMALSFPIFSKISKMYYITYSTSFIHGRKFSKFSNLSSPSSPRGSKSRMHFDRVLMQIRTSSMSAM